MQTRKPYKSNRLPGAKGKPQTGYSQGLQRSNGLKRLIINTMEQFCDRQNNGKTAVEQR